MDFVEREAERMWAGETHRKRSIAQVMRSLGSVIISHDPYRSFYHATSTTGQMVSLRWQARARSIATCECRGCSITQSMNV